MRPSLQRQKKGQIMQIIVFFVIIFALGISIILGKFVMTSVFDALDEGGVMTPVMEDARDEFYDQFGVFDYALVLLSIILIIGLMITAFMIPSHPIFLVVNIFGIFILVFLGMVLNNVFGELVAGEGSADTLGTTADDFPLIVYILTHLPYWGSIVIFLTSVIMFARQ